MFLFDTRQQMRHDRESIARDRSRSPHRGAPLAAEKPTPAGTQDPTVRRRNQIFVGIIQSTLQQAGSQVATSGALKQREEADRRIAERLRAQQEEQEAKRKAEFARQQELRAQQEERQRLAQRKERERQHAAVERGVRAQYAARSQFIRTGGEVRIYWLPVAHTDRTRELLHRSQAEHEAELASALAQLPPLVDAAPATSASTSSRAEGDGGGAPSTMAAVAAASGAGSDHDETLMVVSDRTAHVDDDGVAAMFAVANRDDSDDERFKSA